MMISKSGLIFWATLCIAQNRTMPIMRSKHCWNRCDQSWRCEVWIAKIAAQPVPDCRTDHGKTWPYVSCILGTTSRRRLAKPSFGVRRLGRPACTARRSDQKRPGVFSL